MCMLDMRPIHLIKSDGFCDLIRILKAEPAMFSIRKMQPQRVNDIDRRLCIYIYMVLQWGIDYRCQREICSAYYVIEEIKPTNPLEALIKKQQLSYFGHIMRSENSLEKSMMLGMGGGARKRGRPRARWLDDIKAITNCTLTELCALTRDRDAWRETVMGITRSRPRLDGTR